MTHYKIRDVKCGNDFELYIRFENGAVKRYDVKRAMLKYECFQRLKEEPGLFEKAHADIGGYGVLWDDALDIGCEELWNNGIETK